MELRWAIVVGMAAASCADATRYAIVRVEDPEGLAQGATNLAVGTQLGALRATDLDGQPFPLTLGLKTRRDIAATVWVEVRNADVGVVARGTAPLDFRQARVGAATVVLHRPCDLDADCSDGLFCTGRETCSAGVCQAGVDPCAAPHTCVVPSCDEVSGCRADVDHGACGPNQACNQYLGCRDCSILASSSFCRPDERCIYDPSETQQGECVPRPGVWCTSEGCAPCDDEAHCGQECALCEGNTPICGGVEVGCVVDPARDLASRGCSGLPDFTLCRVESPTRSYNICVRGQCVEPGTGDATSNAPGPHFVLPDTGHRACLDPTTFTPVCAALPCTSAGGPSGCGQDAQYGWDTEHAASERFARTALEADEPLVTDRVTGLMWQGCLVGLSGADCEHGAAPGYYAWDDAMEHCDDSNWGGYSDWRVPDRYELLSVTGHDRWNPTIDVGAFPQTLGTELYASSRTSPVAYLPSTSGMWTTDFSDGLQGAIWPTATLYLRCVRGQPRVVDGPRFARSTPLANQPIVADTRAGLVWQGCSAGQTGATCSGTASFVAWTSALAYCEALTWAGVDDWRLPNLNELTSIVDDSRAEPSIDLAAFPGTPSDANADYWSSTAYSAGHDGAVVVRFVSGQHIMFSKDRVFGHVRCVRSGP